jgi:hypothetical protein
MKQWKGSLSASFLSLSLRFLFFFTFRASRVLLKDEMNHTLESNYGHPSTSNHLYNLDSLSSPKLPPPPTWSSAGTGLTKSQQDLLKYESNSPKKLLYSRKPSFKDDPSLLRRSSSGHELSLKKKESFVAAVQKDEKEKKNPVVFKEEIDQKQKQQPELMKSTHQLAPVFIKTKDYGSDNEDDESVEEVMILERKPKSLLNKQPTTAQSSGNAAESRYEFVCVNWYFRYF